MGGFFMEKFKGFCNENEMKICKPYECHMATCSVGEELRKSITPKECKGTCAWMKQGINGINTCKDPYCPIGQIIVSFKK
jgi:hypothetical protein